MTTYYVAGGVSTKKNLGEEIKRFFLAHPTNDLPYVWSEEEYRPYYRLCEHHCHLYKIDLDNDTFILEEESIWAYPEIEAPKEVHNPDHMLQVKLRMTKEGLL